MKQTSVTTQSVWSRRYAGLPLLVWLGAVAIALVALYFFMRPQIHKTTEAQAVTRTRTEQVPAVQLTPGMVVRAGIATMKIAPHDFTTTVQATGVLQIPDPAQRTITARARGRIEHLYVSSTGAYVSRGERLYDFYTPDIASVEQEFLIARSAAAHPHPDHAMSDMSMPVGAGEHPATTGIIAAARKRLTVLGLTDAQIARLETTGEVQSTLPVMAPQNGVILQKQVQEGAYVEEGTPLMQLADLSTVWATIDVPESYIRFIRLGQAVQLATAAYPNEQHIGKVIFVSPVEDQTSRTVQVRATFTNPALRLRPGMSFLGTFEINMGRMLAIPAGAVVRTGTGEYVWVETSSGVFESHAVTLGAESPDNYYQVLSGLTADNRVAVTGAYLIDAEHEFQKNNPMATMNMSAGDQGAKKSGEGTGIVRSIDLQAQTITLDHGNIPGVMPAMTMAYKASDPGMLHRVHVSEHVRFVLSRTENGEYVITSIDKE